MGQITTLQRWRMSHAEKAGLLYCLQSRTFGNFLCQERQGLRKLPIIPFCRNFDPTDGV
jgi:hypothetical protein